MGSLDDVLKGTTPNASEQAPEVAKSAPDPEQAKQPELPLQEVVEPTGDTSSTPEQQDAQAPQMVPHTVVGKLRDEKRQLAAKVEAYEQIMAQQGQPQQAAPPPEKPATFEVTDEAFFADPAKTFQAHGSHTMTLVEQKLQQQKLARDVAWARHQFEDYDTMEEEFIAYAKDKPGLTQQVLASAAPALEAYKIAKEQVRVRELSKAGSLEDIRATIREEERQKLLAEQANAIPAAASVPAPLTGVRATGGNNAQAWDGPPPLDALFTRQ